MDWQDKLRELSEQVATGQMSAAEYRRRSDEILAESEAQQAQPARQAVQAEQAAREKPPPEPRRTHIPASAAWESPSGEMTQLVGVDDNTTVVPADDPTQKINVEDTIRTSSMRPPTRPENDL